MLLELDHVFVCAPNGEADAEPLIRFGLRPGAARVHQGQGTANLVFCFDNAYLEVLWLHDDTEVNSPVVRPTSLPQRLHWPVTGACPFGVALRQRTDAGDVSQLAAWEYEAPFLGGGATIPVLTPRFAHQEPLMFISPARIRPADYPGKRVELEHRDGRHMLTGVRVCVPKALVLSSGLEEIQRISLVKITREETYRLELEWDGARLGEAMDFGPTLPLSFRW